MNQLPIEKRAQIINLLVEGNSLRATSCIADVSTNTVTKLLVEVGEACEKFHDENVRSLSVKHIQCDEIWSFAYAKNKNGPIEKQGQAGHLWTWTALDPDSKLIISWFVGDRTSNSADIFMKDIASRIATTRPQVSTDGDFSYEEVVSIAFKLGLDQAVINKVYSTDPKAPRGKYNPAVCTSYAKDAVLGNPDLPVASTSHVERQNLTMRIHMRRFAGLADGISKKMANHMCAIALHFVYYNLAKVHKTLRVTPAMEAGLTKKPMTIEEIVELTNNYKSN